MNYPQLNDVAFEIVDERLKIVLPLRRKMPYLIVYSILLLAWIAATIWMLGLLFSTSLRELTTQFMIVWAIILLLWSYIWYRLGRNVWRWWQYYAAQREVLFVDKDILIIRRPLSLLGVTDAYDMEHVSPFYYQDQHGAIAFNYGSRGGLFGEGISRDQAEQVIAYLNARFYPESMELDEY